MQTPEIARADMLHRLDRRDEALAAYDRAVALATNDVERDHLQRRRDDVASP